MFGRFGKDAGSLLGVEIASDSVRILQLHRRNGRCTVSASALEPFEPFGSIDWANDTGRIVAALRRAHRRSGSRQRRVAVALPATQVICKVCHLPASQGEAEMEAQLLAEADQLFPFPLEDLALDFQVLGASQAQADCLDVMVAACRQSVLESLEALFDEAGMQVDAVEVDSIALRRMLPDNGSSGSALLRIEPGRATLHCWLQGLLPQRRELLLGSSPQEHSLERIGQLIAGAAHIEELLVVSTPMLQQGQLQQLGAHLNVPCRELPALASLDPCEGALILVSALALGGMR